MEPVDGSDRPAYTGLVLDAYNKEAVSVMPCSGRSMAPTTKPLSANASATESMSVRLRPKPCWKMSTGHLPGFTPPPAEFAFGTVTRTGTCNISVGTGAGLNRVNVRLLASRADGLSWQ